MHKRVFPVKIVEVSQQRTGQVQNDVEQHADGFKEREVWEEQLEPELRADFESDWEKKRGRKTSRYQDQLALRVSAWGQVKVQENVLDASEHHIRPDQEN